MTKTIIILVSSVPEMWTVLSQIGLVQANNKFTSPYAYDQRIWA